MKAYSYILILMTLLLATCQKEFPKLPESQVTPVFYAKGMIDGKEIEFRAGDDNFIMSSLLWNWNNVPVYRGELHNSENSFIVDLFEGNLLRQATYNELTQGGVFGCAYLSSGEVLAGVAVDNLIQSSGIGTGVWVLNDTTEGQEVAFYEPGRYNLSLSIPGSITYELKNEVIVGYELPYRFRLGAEIQNQIVTLQITENSTDISQVEWSYGMQSALTTGAVQQFQVLNGSVEVIAKVTFSDGAVRERRILVGQGNAVSIEDYVYFIESQLVRYFDYKVDVKIRLGEEKYTTIDVEQNEAAVAVLENELFKDVVTGEQVLKLKMTMTLNLRRESDGGITESVIESIIAMPVME